jgi:hypothetical protein
MACRLPYEEAIQARPRPAQTPAMNKRIVCGVLWFLTGWFVGAFAAFAVGTDAPLGPLLGAAAAALVVLDPMAWFWTPQGPVALAVGTTEAEAA